MKSIEIKEINSNRMIRVYVGHSKKFDYKKELYDPLTKSALEKECQFVFPHMEPTYLEDSKNIIRDCDCMIAEVSYPSTGLGIELGWANAYDIQIICVHRKGTQIASSLNTIADIILEYTDEADLIAQLSEYL